MLARRIHLYKDNPGEAHGTVALAAAPDAFNFRGHGVCRQGATEPTAADLLKSHSAQNGAPSGIVGAGIGGLAAANAPANGAGHDVNGVRTKQAIPARGCRHQTSRPNAVRALDGLGKSNRPLRAALQPRGPQRISRSWDSGQETLAPWPIGADEAEQQVWSTPADHPPRRPAGGAVRPLLRPLHPNGCISASVPRAFSTGARLKQSLLADGSRADGLDVLIGGDGIHSVSRSAQSLPDPNACVGCPTSAPSPSGGAPLPRARSSPSRSTRAPTPSSSPPRPRLLARVIRDTSGSVEETAQCYAGFHPDARALLDACDSVLKTALYAARSAAPAGQQGRLNAACLGDGLPPHDALHGPGRGHGHPKMRWCMALNLARLQPLLEQVPAALRALRAQCAWSGPARSRIGSRATKLAARGRPMPTATATTPGNTAASRLTNTTLNAACDRRWACAPHGAGLGPRSGRQSKTDCDWSVSAGLGCSAAKAHVAGWLWRWAARRQRPPACRPC
ncbi:hypothetical protein FQR65_LT20651 [Abscondita terminalis]|nr:hypothetical protein FQR65_LT20651 [Abscondita terminalis]